MLELIACPGPRSGVSESWLDIHVLPEDATLRIPNTAQGYRQIKRRFKASAVALVTVEASGKFHRALHRSLHDGGYPVAVLNPLRVRLFAEADGVLAKTDKVDARVLALFAARMSPEVRPPQPQAIEALKELVHARESAVAEMTALRNRRGTAVTTFLKTHLKRRIDRLRKDLDALETEIVSRIEADPALLRRYEILLSIPGIGPVVAAVLIACLDELGDCDDKQIAMLAGCAPIADRSGKREGVRTIRGGRPLVRKSLYFAALGGVRANANLKTFYGRLLDAGKQKKVALCAAARKLVILANALVQQNRIWQPEPPNPA